MSTNKILFDSKKRAIGVEFERNERIKTVVLARLEVILAAGAINSPHLLLLSGIGPAEHLKEMRVPVIANLPVGDNLQDHIYPGGAHFTIDKPVSLSQARVVKPSSVVQYLAKGSGPLTTTGVDGLAFVSSRQALAMQAASHKDWPDIELHLVPADVVADNGRYLRHLAGVSNRVWPYYASYARSPSFSIDPVLLRPYSRGTVRLKSRNPHVKPQINPNYLADKRDVSVLIDGLRIAIAVGTSAPFVSRFNSKLFSKKVPGCEHYEFLSDYYLECVIRTLTWTIYHPVGTCKMGNKLGDTSAVVDSQLRVLGGISNLRVVDASVMPYIVSGKCVLVSQVLSMMTSRSSLLESQSTN